MHLVRSQGPKMEKGGKKGLSAAGEQIPVGAKAKRAATVVSQDHARRDHRLLEGERPCGARFSLLNRGVDCHMLFALVPLLRLSLSLSPLPCFPLFFPLLSAQGGVSYRVWQRRSPIGVCSVKETWMEPFAQRAFPSRAPGEKGRHEREDCHMLFFSFSFS